MKTMIDWLIHPTSYGVPHWIFFVLAAWAIVERILGKSKNPAARSILSGLALAMRWFLTFTRIALIPVVGPHAVRFLEFVAGVDIDGDGRVGGDEPTRPGVPPAETPPKQ